MFVAVTTLRFGERYELAQRSLEEALEGARRKAAVHGYTVAFFWAANIFGLGAVVADDTAARGAWPRAQRRLNGRCDYEECCHNLRLLRRRWQLGRTRLALQRWTRIAPGLTTSSTSTAPIHATLVASTSSSSTPPHCLETCVEATLNAAAWQRAPESHRLRKPTSAKGVRPLPLGGIVQSHEQRGGGPRRLRLGVRAASPAPPLCAL